MYNDTGLHESAIGFLNYLHTMKNASDETIKSYNSDLRVFFKFIKQYKKSPCISTRLIKSLKISDLYAFIAYTEKELNNVAITRARKIACLKSYFHYLYKKSKLINEDIAEELESPKLEQKKPITLNIEQSKKLLNSSYSGYINEIRDRCILTLFLNCGLRLSELCNIKLSGIKDDKIIIFGKGSKERICYLNSDALKTIAEYLQVRQTTNVHESERDYLFLSRLSRRMSKKTVENVVKKYLDIADLKDQKYSTHKLRGSFCTNAYRKGAGIKELMVLMGHTNIGTTERYIDYNEETLRSAVANIYD